MNGVNSVLFDTHRLHTTVHISINSYLINVTSIQRLFIYIHCNDYLFILVIMLFAQAEYR